MATTIMLTHSSDRSTGSVDWLDDFRTRNFDEIPA
jgi:hypothetical protein